MSSSNVRQRIAGAQAIFQGVCIALLPFAVPLVLQTFPQVAATVQPIQSSLEPILPWLPWGCWAIAVLLIGSGLRRLLTLSKDNRPIATSVLPALQPLKGQGWQFQSSVTAGDNQTLARSPSGRAFCIVIKAERGRIGSEGRQVFRLVDQSRNPFPSDFITQTRQRSSRVQQAMRLKHVTPVLAFSDAIVAIDSNPVAGVYVVQAQDLRRLLLELA